jgi:GntR family transcriptional regulator
MPGQFYDPFPKYLQIRGIILRQLRSLEVGDPLPTEEALAKRFNVSRETIREAIRPFWENGTIARRPRLGTWLAKTPNDAGDDRLTGPFEDFAALAGAKIGLRSSDAAYLNPSPLIATVLRLLPNERVYQIRRVRTYEDRPLVMLEAVFPERIGGKLEGMDLRDGLFVPVLRASVDQATHEQYQQIEAVAASGEIASLLEVSIGDPLLLVQRIFVDGRSRPVVLFRSHYRADLYFYTVNLPKMRKLPVRGKLVSKRRQAGAVSRAAGAASRPASRPIPPDRA